MEIREMAHEAGEQMKSSSEALKEMYERENRTLGKLVHANQRRSGEVPLRKVHWVGQLQNANKWWIVAHEYFSHKLFSFRWIPLH